MGKASSVKGANAERDISRILEDKLGVPVRRMLGAGRKDDIGDIDIRGFALQIAARANLGDTLRYKPLQCEFQQANAGKPFGASIMKLPPLPGGKPQEWRVVMTVDQFAQVYEALHRNHEL